MKKEREKSRRDRYKDKNRDRYRDRDRARDRDRDNYISEIMKKEREKVEETETGIETEIIIFPKL